MNYKTMNMKTIKLSTRQWEWVYWLTGNPQFEEECPEWDQALIERIRSCDFKEDSKIFSFPEDQEVIDYLHEELERLKEMQSDDLTGYYEENDKRVYGNLRSINQLISKIN